ncbi:MAG: phage portal protein [Oscillospiraceae bacterium]|nr:phage portal protein [Oscillospiraceae bacterium]MBQ8622703.1 phage portal protein [Oscillospiraceae bacterium]MBQ8835792.1 phage portal protein [Oscillospiraceae bacterium]
MSKKKNRRKIDTTIIKASEPIKKADTSVQLNKHDQKNSADWLEPPVDLNGLKVLVNNSTILPQCIRSYKNNIAGFGIGIKYRDDAEENTEMSTEFTQAAEIVDLLNIEQDTKKVFEDLIEARETYGIAYLEVIRSMDGNVQEVCFIRDTPSMRKTRPLEPYIDTSYFYKGREVKRKKKFCKYRQQVGGNTVYFKEFGDPRIMDLRDGKYAKDGESIDLQYQANEILEFAIGTEPYGEVRWIGQVLSADGSRRAEELNNNYFRNGRHTPLMIIVKGGTLTEESFTKLQGYMDGIKGAAGQHSFIILETEAADDRTDFTDAEQPEVEVKDLASILQKDELFQDYLDNNRRKIQSSFQLPDLYTGYTTDFNRATAMVAMEVTEEQVFQPERQSIAWIINNRLLNAYRFKHVEVFFKSPDISNPDDLFKILTVCNNAGGLTPNKAKDIAYKAIGETAEDFPAEWGDVPIAVQKSQSMSMAPDYGALTAGIEKQIAKATAAHDDAAIVAVMKEVKSLLVKMSKGG